MPLQARDDWRPDHPVWNTVLGGWAVQVMGLLNRTLPRGTYRAFLDVTSGLRIGTEAGDRGGPPPSASKPFVFTDVCEVHVVEPTAHVRPVGAVVFVRSAAKRNVLHRQPLVWTCLSYLHRGVSLALVDVIDAGVDSIHDDLATFLGVPCLGSGITVAGYRPVYRDDEDQVDVWAYPLKLGQPIPAVPLGLRGGPVVLLDLEGTYTAAIEATGL